MNRFVGVCGWFISCVFLSVISASALAHHSFATEYRVDARQNFVGTVTQLRYSNPHIELYVTDDSGTLWNLQAQSVAALQSLGWDANAIAVGDRINARGYPSRSGSLRMYLVNLTLDSGREFSVIREGASSAASVAASIPDGFVVGMPADAELLQSLTGTWAFDVDKPLPGAPLPLRFEGSADLLTAYLDFESLPVEVSADQFRILLQRENAGGFGVTLELVGRLQNSRLQGSVRMIEGETNQANLDAASFTAIRVADHRFDLAQPKLAEPVDLSGVWRRTIGVGPIGRTNPQLNEAGQELWQAYSSGRYDPALRCLSVNPMRKYADPGMVEILQDDGRITILYASKHDVRRVYLDRQNFTQGRPADVMGESIGYWDGSTLVIETANFTPSVLTHNSEPVSSNATITERFWLEPDGSLVMEARLDDPDYYQAPVIRRTAWQRENEAPMINLECDPDSFYQGMLFDGTLQNYFDSRP